MTEKSFTISLSKDQNDALDQYVSDLDLPSRNSGLENIVAVRLGDYKPLNAALAEDAALQSVLSELSSTIVESRELNGQIRVRLNGDGVLQAVKASPAALIHSDAEKLGQLIMSAYGRALEKVENLRKAKLEPLEGIHPF